MKRPWMPLYVADYLHDTRHLTTVEHGAYMLLIMEYWQRGGLPLDERRLARLAGITDREWKGARASLIALFGPEWKHKRIDAELAKVEDISGKRRAAVGNRRDRLTVVK